MTPAAVGRAAIPADLSECAVIAEGRRGKLFGKMVISVNPRTTGFQK
jgi:hypothetical protein